MMGTDDPNAEVGTRRNGSDPQISGMNADPGRGEGRVRSDGEREGGGDSASREGAR